MSDVSEELIADNLAILDDETMKVAEQVAAYQRKMMAPVWYKRREMVKKIPNFWPTAFGNSPIFTLDPSENDLEALEHLEDFHVDFDDARPEYRKITATFKKNNLFKNETLTKEILVDADTDGEVISKTEIEYHENKAPSNKRKADQDDEDNFEVSFLQFFGDNDVRSGILMAEDVFPNAVEYYQGPEDDEDDEDEDEIDLDEESEDDEDEVPKSKKQKK